MYSRWLVPPKDKSFFLFGPRGTGKTTWVKSVFPEAIYIDLLEAEIFNDLLAHPQRLQNFIPQAFRGWVILDEVQRVADVLNEVHRLIEKYKYKFILTGSSSRKLRKKGHNLLAGRALTLSMHPLTAGELGEDFNLPHSLAYGHLPCVYAELDPKAYLESYIKTYLEQEVQQERLTQNLSAFSRFLEAASFSQGSVLNISEVARDCAVERKVVENYFMILEELLIGYRIPVFSRKSKRRLLSHSKFYFFDTGIYRTLRPMGPLDRPEETEAIALETLLFQELIAVNAARRLGYQLFYWRTPEGHEVDFVLYGSRGIKVFEIKRTGKVSGTMLKGLKLFLKDYPLAKAFFIYGGERRMREGSIEIVPMNELFRKLPEFLTDSVNPGGLL